MEIKDIIRWKKSNPMPRNTNRRYVTDYEFAIWATMKGSKWTFNKPNDKPYLRPEFETSIPISKYRIHPTQKSETLIEEIIKVHSNPNDIIFDPFSGSGQISVSSYKLGRKFIGVEIDEKYYNASIQRINNLYIRPAFNHLGNKYRILNDLYSVFYQREIDNFYDVFCGSSIVSLNIKYCKNIVANDNDKTIFDILNEFKNKDINYIFRKIEKIIKDFDLPKINIGNGYTQQYNLLKEQLKKDNNPIILFVLILFGFNQQIRFNSKGEFNIPAGKFFWNDYQKDKIFNFINQIKKMNIEFQNQDFEVFVKDTIKKSKSKNNFYYFDPPYLITEATYNTHWTIKEENKLLNLLEFLLTNNINWALSNQLISKGKVNEALLKFLEKNKNYLKIYLINTTYKNSNYQRKNIETENDLEILVLGGSYEK